MTRPKHSVPRKVNHTRRRREDIAVGMRLRTDGGILLTRVRDGNLAIRARYHDNFYNVYQIHLLRNRITCSRAPVTFIGRKRILIYYTGTGASIALRVWPVQEDLSYK